MLSLLQTAEKTRVLELSVCPSPNRSPPSPSARIVEADDMPLGEGEAATADWVLSSPCIRVLSCEHLGTAKKSTGETLFW